MTAKDDIRKRPSGNLRKQIGKLWGTDEAYAQGRRETLAAAIKVVEGIPSECGTAIIERAGTRFDEEDEPDDRLWHYLLMEETMKDVLAKLKEMGK